jgi:hypothetical protein
MISSKSIFKPPIMRNHSRLFSPFHPLLQFHLVFFFLFDPTPFS